MYRSYTHCILAFCVALNLYCCTKKTVINVEGYKELSKIEPSQVNFLGHWLNEGKKEKLLLELINEFEFTNQDIKINMKYPEEIYFDRRKYNIEIQFNAHIVKETNPKWDIIRLNNEVWKIADSLNDPDWTKKYLVDFSEIPEFKNTTKPELLTDEVKSLYGGIIPGPFIDGYNWPLWVNTEIAKKVGVEVKQFDMTAEDFMGYIKAVFDYNMSHKTDTIMALYDAWNWSTAESVAQSLFFSEVSDYKDIINFKFSEKKLDAWKKVLEQLEKYSAYKPLPDFNKITWTETQDYPLKGKCLFYINGSWMYNIWLEIDSSKLKYMMPAELPVFKPSPMTIGGYFVTWAVLKNSPNRDKAVHFLLSLNKPDVAEKWARYTKSPTGIKGNLTSFNFGADKLENYQYVIEKKYGSNKTNTFNDSRYCFGNEYSTIKNRFVEVMTGTKTARIAMDEIYRELRRKK